MMLGVSMKGSGKIPDKRKARGKCMVLETVLMIIVMAKLCGEDTPSGMADWGKHHGESSWS